MFLPLLIGLYLSLSLICEGVLSLWLTEPDSYGYICVACLVEGCVHHFNIYAVVTGVGGEYYSLFLFGAQLLLNLLWTSLFLRFHKLATSCIESTVLLVRSAYRSFFFV